MSINMTRRQSYGIPNTRKLKFPDVGHTEVRRYAALGKALHRGNGYAFRYRGMISNAFNGVSSTADHLNQQRGEIEFTSTGPVVSSQNVMTYELIIRKRVFFAMCNGIGLLFSHYRALPSSLAQSQRLYRVPLPRDHQNISNSPAPARSEANTQTLQHTRLRCKVLTPDKFKVKSISYVMKYSGFRTAFAQHRVGKVQVRMGLSVYDPSLVGLWPISLRVIITTLFLRMPSLNSYLATAFPQIYPSVKISAPPQAPANKVKSLQIKIWRILSPGLAGPHEYRVSET
ncbi:hypothetical protein FocTR4_00007426 [Fusarium oxysporum f. sp. cubense]|uniref:Uncharacterized protein n=1 Tax=Fusarium oxysporum f. sp. cubense TaxID=61366 RepID=A0A5C6TPX0_FUSOC|nr:hypothetical protein FocTR4_00007426 [Fusarium oxysporum f. sp. cubense]